ncbi:MAG: hypothetical protein U0234_00580 [Sandaracinus sp.]
MMELLSLLPGTVQWARAKFTPKIEHRLRVELRKLARAADARVAVLWMPVRRGADEVGEVIAYSGDREAIPSRFGFMSATVPTWVPFALDDRERIDAVAQVVQLGRGLPVLYVAAIAPGPADSAALFDLVEECAARLEQVAVSAM